MGESSLEDLIALRKREREEEQLTHTRETARAVDEALGPRVLAAMDPGGAQGWTFSHATGMRRLHLRTGEYHLVLTAMRGVGRVEVELRHIDSRFASLAKRASLADLSEDWFLNAAESLSAQVQDRLTSPKNFV
ncbi:hypothetical protein [Mesoterricola silvestris]|uniref:Uncharacterized protein n=1 Tax=Mesoterricola silvestris TaxID=2927979 RepID=A0AA48GXZ5_9BACT|nr:hypothetical protein [Mesoterricola silvestris]BDU73936.1 hypothetical protein METEAL_31100 [Mesoterricola silvestris]